MLTRFYPRRLTFHVAQPIRSIQFHGLNLRIDQIDELLRYNEAALRLRDGDAVFFRRLKPESYRFFSIRDRLSASIPVCHTTGKLGHVDDEHIVFAAPPNDHFVTRSFH
jgi:hypothetical protein